MALIETVGDYQFAESVKKLSRDVSKISESYEAQIDVNIRLMDSIRQLTEVIEYQNEQYKELKKRFDEKEYEADDTRPDLVLM